MDGLLIGAIVAIYRKRGVPGISKYLRVLLIVLLGGLIFSITWNHYAGSMFKPPTTTIIYFVRVTLPLLVSFLFGLLLIESLTDNNFFSRVMSFGFLSFIAKYSYGLYVIHYLLLPLFIYYLYPIVIDFFGNTDGAIYTYFFLTSFISLILAIVSFYGLERWFLLLKDRI